jgi:hypothetical protein
MRSNRMIWSLGVLFLILVLSACGDQVPATESIPEPTATEPASTPAPVAPVPSPTAAETVATTQIPEEEIVTNQPTMPSALDPGLEPLLEQAKEDLAQRLSVPIDQIEVLEAELVVWPDASLGCPQPGMRYRQVPMDGALIRLQAEGQVYEYHSGGSRGLFLCEQPLKQQTDPPPSLDLFELTPGSPDD